MFFVAVKGDNVAVHQVTLHYDHQLHNKMFTFFDGYQVIVTYQVFQESTLVIRCQELYHRKIVLSQVSASSSCICAG